MENFPSNITVSFQRKIMNYTIKEHKHRFSSWAASRAASIKGCRFSVEIGKNIIEECGLHEFIDNPSLLPEPQNIDSKHREWRKQVISSGKKYGIEITHGVAAKLINMYFKSALVCGGSHEDERVKALHPPIDSLILDSLIKNNIGGYKKEWRKFSRIRWSKLNCQEYEDLIAKLRSCFGINNGFWHVENHWQGYR
jgi:hypothetical protein